MMTEITASSRVSMHFSITLEDGTVAESSFDEEPISFVMGDGTLNTGLEKALIGLAPGDEQTVTLKPEQAFGYHDDENIHEMQRNEFDPEIQLEAGVIIGFTTPAGDEVPGMVLETKADKVRIDFNHPLAGHDLLYSVKILGVE